MSFKENTFKNEKLQILERDKKKCSDANSFEDFEEMDIFLE